MTTSANVVRFVIPKGRSAAERRLAAIAALHSPSVVDHGTIVTRGHALDLGRELTCPACSSGRSYEKVAWPCATARLLGPWPGELEDEP